MSKRDIDELVRWRDKCEALAASLQRKVRHCDEITEERDKALRERDEARARCETLRELADVAALEQGLAQRRMMEAQRERDEAQARVIDAALIHAELVRERDEARAELDGLRLQIERLRGVLHIVSLDEYESTSSAAEKVHAHARQARVVLNETLAVITPSDAAHVASLENLFLKACKRAEKWETASKDAYRRGAEAMRLACQQWCRAWENNGEAIADALADLRVEDKP